LINFDKKKSDSLKILDAGSIHGLFGCESALKLKNFRGEIRVWALLDTRWIKGTSVLFPENSIDSLKDNARAEGVEDLLQIEEGEFDSLPFSNGEFDLIVSGLSLHFVGGKGEGPLQQRERAKVVQEFARVLKIGGHAVVWDTYVAKQYYSLFLENHNFENVSVSGPFSTFYPSYVVRATRAATTTLFTRPDLTPPNSESNEEISFRSRTVDQEQKNGIETDSSTSSTNVVGDSQVQNDQMIEEVTTAQNEIPTNP